MKAGETVSEVTSKNHSQAFGMILAMAAVSSIWQISFDWTEWKIATQFKVGKGYALK